MSVSYIIKIHFVYVTPFIASPDIFFFLFPSQSSTFLEKDEMIQCDFSFPFPLTSKLEHGNLPGGEDKGPNHDTIFVSKYTGFNIILFGTNEKKLF